jgi:hypothetical protein
VGKNADTTEQTYRIGAIARLTGVPADTLRVWERRYGVVTPLRSGKGGRLYRREDVARLALIKRLVDAGHAIGSIARLTGLQLEERFATLTGPAPPPLPAPHPAWRVAILGDTMPARLAAEPVFREGLEIVALERDPGRFRAALPGAQADVLVLEYPSVHAETAAEVASLLHLAGAARALVVYAFGRVDSVRRLDTSRVTPLRAPVEPVELRRWCLAAASSSRAASAPGRTESLPGLDVPPPPRRFDSEALSRLATASTTVRCECPHHLVQLIYSLTAFEQYSAECESRGAEDAALHALLHRTTARARSLIEEALARLLEIEGLAVRAGDGRVSPGVDVRGM